MNTKGIKFLAVLAVMVMAFAAIVVLAPADRNADAVTFTDVQVDPAILGGAVEEKYYISDDATVKVKKLDSPVTIYVQNGKELVLDIREDVTKTITVITVTSDLEAHTTSTVDDVWSGQVTGKTYVKSTTVTFEGVKGQTFVYNAMAPKVTTKYIDPEDISVTIKTSMKYATISSDEPLKSAYIGTGVTVASGQSVAADSNSEMSKFGVMIYDDSEDYPYTYYATGMNVGTIALEEGADKVVIKNGSANVKVSGATIKATTVSSTSGVTISTNSGVDALTVTGTFSSGSMTVDGKVTVSNVGVGSSAIFTVATNADLQTDSKVTVDGGIVVVKVDKEMLAKLTIDDKQNGTPGVVKVENKKAWTYTEREPSIKFPGSFTGLIDVSSVNDVANVDERFSTAKIEEDQAFKVIKDVTISSSLTVEGILIIDEGVTLTVYKNGPVGAAIKAEGQYAQIINYGQIIIRTTAPDEDISGDKVGFHVLGGYSVNYGKINATSDADTDGAVTFAVGPIAKGLGFANYGDVTISKNDTVSFTDAFVNSGSLTIGGKFAGEGGVTFINDGAFTLSNAIVNQNINVKMGEMAVFTVVSAKFEVSNTSAPQIIATNNVDADKNPATITITGAADAQIRGITITDASYKYDGVTYYQLDIAGPIGVSGLADGASINLALSGSVTVVTETTVAKGYTLDFSGSPTLTVIGDLALADGVKATSPGNLNMDVLGSVTVLGSNDILQGCKFSGAKYAILSGVTIYTNIDDALSEAIELGINLVEVGCYGATITEDVTIPAGMNVSGMTVGSSKAVLKVGNSIVPATVTVKDGAALAFSVPVQVINGAIFVENIYDLDQGDVVADIKDVNDNLNTAVYMSLGYALDHATAGQVLVLTQDFVLTSGNLTIPEGVIVDATVAPGDNDFVLIDSNLTVNGALKLNHFYFVATTDDTKSITLNGYIMEDDEDGTYLKDHWYTPLGVSYKWTITDAEGEENTWFVITNLARIQEAIDVADEAKVTVEGDAELGDLTLTGRDDMPAEVTFNGDLDAGTITIDDVTLVFKQDNKVSATVANALGSITITGAYVKSTTMSIYSLDDGIVTMTGAIRDDDSGSYSIRFDGLTGMEDATIGWGYNDDYYPTILFNGITTATGKKDIIRNIVDNERYNFNAGIVTIAGSLIADNATRLAIDADVEVLDGAALVASERTEEAVDGTIEVNGDIFVGASKSDLYDVDDAMAATKYHEKLEYAFDNGYGRTVAEMLSGNAILSGKIMLGKIADYEPEDPTEEPIEGKDVFITAVAGAEIDPQIIEDLDYMDVLIEGEVWITVYGESSAIYCLDGLKAPIVNAKVDTITDAEGNVVAKFSHVYKVVYGSETNSLTGFGVINFDLNYDAFTVTIKTDGSVKAVYIDGILMYTGQNENVFVLRNVATGTHKVTVEAATGYDADKCVLYTELGTILPGMAFTFTEYDCVFQEGINTYNVVYNINGTEIQPEPVPPTPEEESQWTITTILLVILVVLIAIMAVIVALRLNRS